MSDRPCLVCGGEAFRALPVLSPQSMLSDGRPVPHTLARRSCLSCGLGDHITPPTESEIADFYNEEYSLYAHAPGGAFEAKRQNAYAAWIDRLVDLGGITSLFEAGCGNGSLLTAIRERRPALRLQGVEPAPAAAQHAAACGLDVESGFLDPSIAQRHNAEVVLSVNVIEHSANPEAFLRVCAQIAGARGRVLVICPNGDTPSNELLFYDHIHSFSTAAMVRLAAKAGLTVKHRETGPEGLAVFHAFILSPSAALATIQCAAPETIANGRAALLRGWAGLDAALARRAEGCDRLLGFGAGEAAALIRAYAPRIWARLSGLVMDGGSGAMGDLPISDYRDLAPAAGQGLLLLLEPAKQTGLAARLESDGHRTLVWNDLVAQPDEAGRRCLGC